MKWTHPYTTTEPICTFLDHDFSGHMDHRNMATKLNLEITDVHQLRVKRRNPGGAIVADPVGTGIIRKVEESSVTDGLRGRGKDCLKSET